MVKKKRIVWRYEKLLLLFLSFRRYGFQCFIRLCNMLVVRCQCPTYKRNTDYLKKWYFIFKHQCWSWSAVAL